MMEVEATPESLVQEETAVWSKLAIVTFLLSLASPLALVTGFFFWPTTFLTAVFAVAAVILAARGGKSVRGGSLACAAVFLSLFFLSLAITRYAVQQQATINEARVVAERWFKLIQEGKFNEAHQMTLSSEVREAPEIPIDEAYRLSDQARNGRDSFFLQPPIKHLVNDPQNCRVTFLKLAGQELDEKAEVVKLRFTIRYRELMTPHETIFTLAVARNREPRFEDHRWGIRGITNIQTK